MRDSGLPEPGVDELEDAWAEGMVESHKRLVEKGYLLLEAESGPAGKRLLSDFLHVTQAGWDLFSLLFIRGQGIVHEGEEESSRSYVTRIANTLYERGLTEGLDPWETYTLFAHVSKVKTELEDKATMPDGFRRKSRID